MFTKNDKEPGNHGEVCDAGVERIVLPPRSPNLNAYAERWVRSVKDEALARMILFGEGSLRHVLNEPATRRHSSHHSRMRRRLIRRRTWG